MLRIGVTGRMASGKTDVATRFREHGARVVDGDALGWEVLREAAQGDSVARKQSVAPPNRMDAMQAEIDRLTEMVDTLWAERAKGRKAAS